MIWLLAGARAMAACHWTHSGHGITNSWRWNEACFSMGYSPAGHEEHEGASGPERLWEHAAGQLRGRASGAARRPRRAAEHLRLLRSSHCRLHVPPSTAGCMYPRPRRAGALLWNVFCGLPARSTLKISGRAVLAPQTSCPLVRSNAGTGIRQ